MFEFEMKSSNGEILPLDPVTWAGRHVYISPALSAGVSWQHDSQAGVFQGLSTFGNSKGIRTVKTHRNT